MSSAKNKDLTPEDEMTKVYCGKCKIQLDESGSENLRNPCPACGSILRDIHVEIHDTGKASDHVGMLAEREGQTVGFRESERDGRITSADANDDGSLNYSIKGNSPQGEEDTLSACNQLIKILNQAGANWASPVPGDGVEDCVAVDNNDSKNKLLIQVIRAVVSRELWKRLNLEGKYENNNCRQEDLVEFLKEAISKKASDKKIPPSIRQTLVLALDANRLPVMGFTGVIAQYRSLYQTWTKAQGFREVWVVGPNAALVQRLD